MTTHLDLRTVIELNRDRCRRWHADADDWSGADWSNAMCGEAGEAANIVKKLRRHETSTGTAYNTPQRAELLPKLGEEIADTILYALLLAEHYDVDVIPALCDKFNRVSAAQGFPERLYPTGDLHAECVNSLLQALSRGERAEIPHDDLRSILTERHASTLDPMEVVHHA